MRIISVVTLISPDGSYGGPTRVALNQSGELLSRGHDVVVVAGSRGYPKPPTSIDGVPVELFPVRTAVPGTGFAGLTSPPLLRWLRAAVAQADVVHVHTARDLITLPAAWLVRHSGTPYLLQTHGMIDPSRKASARWLDRVLTKRLLREASSVFYLTERERSDLLAVSKGPLRLTQLLNGVPEAAQAAAPAAGREVLYLARLQSRKRPQMFVRLAQELAAEFPDATFTLVGPDEGEGAETSALIRQGRGATWDGPIPPDQALARMAQAAIYVLPAVDEPFPMSVLEAMSIGRPVVITDSCGLAPLVQESGCGIVCDSSQSSLTDAVRRLLSDDASAADMGRRGLEVARERLSMAAVGDTLEAAYGRACV